MEWTELLARNLAARTFEEAAALCVRALCATAGGARSGAVHLRDAAGYRAFAAHRADGSPDPRAADRLVEEAGSWAAVAAGRESAATQPDERGQRPMRDPGGGGDTIALPLRGPGGQRYGFATLRLDGVADALDPMRDALQQTADLCAPTLAALPSTTTAAPPDAIWPVSGAATVGLLAMLGLLAPTSATLLLRGPVGAGRGRLATWVHRRSGWSGSETVHMAGVPAPLQLGALVGWRCGALPTATRDQEGALARTAGGTLVIEGVERLTPEAQAGLQDVLATRLWRPLGDDGPGRPLRARLILTATGDLEADAARGALRSDLLETLSAAAVTVPSLAQRRDELDGWASFFAAEAHRRAGLPGVAVVSDDARAALRAEAWPGELRQLEGATRRAYAIALSSGDGRAEGVRIRRVHVEAAIAAEAPEAEPAQTGLIPCLHAVARAFLDEARARSARGERLSIEHADALYPLILAIGLEELGDLRGVWTLLDREGVVSARHHFREFRRRRERVVALYEALGEPIDEALKRALTL